MKKPKKTKLAKKRPKNAGRKKIYKGFSRHALAKIAEAGLPQPALQTRQEAIALQKQWYAKLAAEGFEDIEWVDHKTGYGQDSPYLKGSLALGKVYHPGRALYFDLALNYLQHCKALRGFDKFIWRIHANAGTYDQMVTELKKSYKNVPSRYTLFYRIKEIAQRAYKWNCTNPEGLFVKRIEDRQLIADTHLAEFVATEYNWILGEEAL